MPTTKKRISLILKKENQELLGHLARAENIAEASKAAELLNEKLEELEDQILYTIALDRDKPGTKFTSLDDIKKKYNLS